MKITLPLQVEFQTGKSASYKWYKFILNLNNYRNAHHRTLAPAKKAYSDIIWDRIPDTAIERPVMLTYTYYAKTKRRLDISNPCSIIDKFTCDALVKKGLLPDDDYNVIKGVTYKWGGIDKENPRCELMIEEIKQ
jgi:Holliday junction resolvase RusA-like endonuclease